MLGAEERAGRPDRISLVVAKGSGWEANLVTEGQWLDIHNVNGV